MDYFKTFINIVEKESLSEAAKSMGISQPAITMQLKAMEKEYGQVLLDRSPGLLKLTEAGKIFLDRARRIVEEENGLRESLSDLSGFVGGELTLGSSTTPGEYLVPKMLGRFKSLNPNVEPKLLIGDSEEILSKLGDHIIDIAIVGLDVTSDRFSKLAFAKDELTLIYPPESPLSKLKKAKVKDILKYPLIIREEGSATRKKFEEALDKVGLSINDFNVTMELGSLQAIIAAVEAGLGVSVISKWAAEKEIKLGLVGGVEISDLDLARNLYLIFDKKRSLTRTQKEFIDFARNEYGKT